MRFRMGLPYYLRKFLLRAMDIGVLIRGNLRVGVAEAASLVAHISSSRFLATVALSLIFATENSQFGGLTQLISSRKARESV